MTGQASREHLEMIARRQRAIISATTGRPSPAGRNNRQQDRAKTSPTPKQNALGSVATGEAVPHTDAKELPPPRFSRQQA